MALSTLAIIGIIEACLLAVLVISALLYYILELKRQLKKALTLQSASAQQASSNGSLHPSDASIAQRDRMAASSAQKTYASYIEDELIQLRDYHLGLGGGRDISLDIEPSTPLARRVAAVRHAVLVAERESIQPKSADWPTLIARYKALLSYCDDFLSPKAIDKIKELKQTLTLTKQRLVTSEKYKDLYFDLEASWNDSKTKASDYHEQIKGHLEKPEAQNNEQLIELVGQYHKSYDSVKVIFDSQEPMPLTIEAASEELRELRRTTSEQYQTIETLKKQISMATDDNAKVSLIRGLEDELNRQQRFIKESESCVKLLEDELTSVHKELQNLKVKVKEMPRLRAYIKELEEDAGVGDVVANRQKDEIRALKAELATLAGTKGQAAPKPLALDSGAEVEALKKQYAELEERYLDLKLNG